MSDKYDIGKTIKFSNKNIMKLDYLVKEKKFKNDSEATRFCVDVVVALSKNNLLTESMAKLFEDME